MTFEQSIIYLAGIIDGEGCIGIECMAPCKKKDGTWIRKHNYYTPRLTVINTSKKVIDLLMKTFGGTYSTRKTIQGRKTCFAWRIFGEALINVLRAVIPYLQIKYDQAQLVLEFRKTVGKTGWHVSEEILEQRHSFYLQCKILNQVGS